MEGSSRQSDGEFGRFLDIALGSCGETIYHLILARDLAIIDMDSYQELRKGHKEDLGRGPRLIDSLRSKANR